MNILKMTRLTYQQWRREIQREEPFAEFDDTQPNIVYAYSADGFFLGGYDFGKETVFRSNS